MPDHGKTFFSWRIDEFTKHRRPTAWYVGAAVVFMVLMGYAIATLNFLFALIVIIIAILMILTASREPRKIAFAITEDGLEIDEDFFPWNMLRDFWIVYNPGDIKCLYANFRNIMRPRLSAPLDAQDPVAMRETLLRYLPEDDTRHDEPFSEYLGRVLKI